MPNINDSISRGKEVAERLQAVIVEFCRRRADGEEVSDESLIAAHPELMPALGQELRKLKIIDAARHQADELGAVETKTFQHDPSATLRGKLDVRCPNCHSSILVAVDTNLTELTCDSCGLKFSLLDESEASQSCPPLSTIGRFDLVGRLGMGAFGVVWKAHDKELDRTVAIKIPRRGGMTADEQERFLREARTAAQLRHSNIVSVHEVGRDGDAVYIVSDFIQGSSLDEWLADQQLTIREAVGLCVKITAALHHAHEQGVIHRDLKPANIMIDRVGEPHVTDFGLARRTAAEITVSLDGVVIGTPAYMSPEQAQGEGYKADGRSDVYSLGVLLFELLTGELPFRGNVRMLLDQVIKDEPPSPRKFNANVPKDLETVTLKCLEKDPASRYQTADEFAEELRRYLRGEPVLARPLSRAERTWRWCRRRPAVAGLVATALVSLVACGVWGIREIRNAREWRLQLSDSLVQSAELHGRTGEWKKALGQLDEASALGNRNAMSLQLQRVKALIALASPEAEPAIRRLAGRADLGAYEADVRLLQALDQLAVAGMDSAAPLFADAKAAGTLSASDVALVDGIMAPTSQESLAQFRRAVGLAPFSQEARRFLVLMLTTCGRFDEATKQGEVGQEFFPEDPNFPLMLAYTAAGAGRMEEVSQRLKAKSLHQVDPHLIQQYGDALQNLQVLHEESAKLWDFAFTSTMRRNGWSDPQMQEDLLGKAFSETDIEIPKPMMLNAKPEELLRQLEVIRAVTSLTHVGNTETMPVSEVARLALKRVPNCLVIAYDPIRDLFSLRTQGYLREGKGSLERIDNLIDRLAASVRAHPDGFFSYTRGCLLFVRGRLPQAAEAFSAAAKQYSLFGSIAASASFAAARTEFAMYRMGDSGALARAVENLRTRIAMGPLRPMEAAALFQVAMEGKDFDSARCLLAAGDVKKQPTPRLLVEKAEVELAAENYLEALRVLKNVPETSKEHAAAKEIQKQCIDKLAHVVNGQQIVPADSK